MNLLKTIKMNAIEKKTIKTSIQGIGNMEFQIIQIGNPKWLTEIEIFLTQNEGSFTVIAIQKPELKNSLYMQRAIQAFVDHIQAGGDEQQSNQIRNHFRNWINKKNGSLKSIIYGESTTSNEPKQSLRESFTEAFNQRFRGGQQTGN